MASEFITLLEDGTLSYSPQNLIFSIFVVLFCAVIVLLVGQKLRMPIIIGYFITGIIVGPYCLNLIGQAEADFIAEFGVILLMFTIGMEISLKNLLAMKKIVLIGGTIQLLLTTAIVCGIMMLLNFSFSTSLFIGFLVAHSSTAIIMSIYQKTGEVDQAHGKMSLGLLIFQDLNVVPMMMLIPLFVMGDGNTSDTDILSQVLDFLFSMGIVAIIFVLAIWLVPKILKHIALKRNSELFVIAIVVICFGIAYLMSLNNVSLALGAFLAGIAISQSDYSHEVIGQIMPIREILVSFFFVSIGMMLNLSVLWQNIVLIILLALALMVLKTGINFISVKVLGLATGACLISAVGISQIGEFSFILGKECVANNIIPENVYQIFLAISIITMALTPFLTRIAPKIVNKLIKPKVKDTEELSVCKKEHEIIVGYGLTGQYVAKALKKLNIPYIILETNTETVEHEKNKGENIIFGDASRDAILEAAEINKAKSIVITIPIMEAVKAIVTTARRLNPNITIITRSRFIGETTELYKLGADEVIVDERESAIQIFKRILASKHIPVQDIDLLSKELRCQIYEQYIDAPKTHQNPSGDVPTFFDNIKIGAKKADGLISKEQSQIEQIRVEPKSSVCGQKISDINFRSDYGISVLAIKHKGGKDAEVSPDGETLLKEGDTIVVMGQPDSLVKLSALFNEQPKN